MDTKNRVQTLDVAVCISHCTRTFDKGMNPIIFPLAMDKQLNRLVSLTLVWQLVKDEKSINSNDAEKLSFCRILLVQRGLVNINKHPK